MRTNQSLSLTAFLLIIGSATLATAQNHLPGGMAPASSARSAQIAPGRSSGPRRPSQITGTALDSEGQPIAGAKLVLRRVGGALTAQGPETTTDEHGMFSFEGLGSGAYFFVYPPDVDDYGEPRLYRPGDTVTLRNLRNEKGGVITGTVTMTTGEPVIEAPVRAIRIRNAEGTPVRPAFYSPGSGGRGMTDDRGIYRVWGLLPGSYLVAAGGKWQEFGSPGAYDDDVPTYYPSASEASAKVVQVGSGQEVSGIDIRYIGDTGHKISGAIIGVNQNPGQDGGVVVLLAHASTGAIQSMVSPRGSDDPHRYAIASVPDGQYCLTGALVSNNDFEGSSACRAVTVSGADVTGADIVITRLATISGRVSVEVDHAGSNPDCKPTTQARGSAASPGAGTAPPAGAASQQISETVISVSPDQRAGEGEISALLRMVNPAAMPDSKGDFAVSKLGAGRYDLTINLPGKDWYVAAISQPGPGEKPRPIDDTVSVKPGEQLTGLSITVRPGAAGLSGRVVSSSGRDGRPPLRVYLVPIDQTASFQGANVGQASSLPQSESHATASELSAQSPGSTSSQSERTSAVAPALKYREAEVLSDGRFALTNLAPGKYRLVAIPRTTADSQDSPRPLTRGAEGRARLEAASKDHGTELDLKPCARIDDFVLKF